nr:hypothetical protein [Tanacetum cinerariifolium]
MPRIVGTYDDEAGSSRPKRTRHHETVEDAMLPHVHYEFLQWCNANRTAKKFKVMPEIKVYEMGGEEEIFSFEAWRRTFDINKPIHAELCHKFYSTYEFNKVVIDKELMTKKFIKFRLGGRGHSLTLIVFSCRLGLYCSHEIRDEGCEVYFQGGLRNNDHFNAHEYWLSISSEEELHLSRSVASTIRSPIRRVLQKMILMVCVNEQLAKKISLLIDEVLNGLRAPVYYRSLDVTTLRELIISSGRLITEDLAPGVPRFSMPRPLRPTMQDLYDKLGSMEIHQGVLERISYRKLYHIDRYAGVFEYMAGQYNIPLKGAYAPPSYDEEEQQQEE